MIKKNEFPRRNNNQGNQPAPGQNNTPAQPQRNMQEQNKARESEPNRTRENEQNRGRENNQSRGYYRDNGPRQNNSGSGYSSQGSSPRYQNRVKADETLEDIKAEITRIEKEIDLEIKEIKTMRLGL